MSTFTYKARDEAGQAVKGVMEAESQEQLAQKLRRMGYMPTQILAAQSSFAFEDFGKRFERIGAVEMIMFNLQLANMIDSGLMILTSLRAIQEQCENKKLKQILSQVERSVEAGATFSESLAQHNTVFPKLFVSMVKAGETTGHLPTVLNRFASYAEQREDLRQKILSACFYPMILLIAGIAVICFIVTFVVPRFVDIFQKTGIPLPMPTQIIYSLGLGIKHFWYLILVAILGLVAFVKYYRQSERGKYQFDQMILKIPVIGTVARKVIVSRFCRTLATLVDSGVPLLQGLQVLKEVVGNEVFARLVQNVHDSVQGGDKISQTLKVSQEFPPDVIQMIISGEETGQLGKMLNKAADFYDTAIEYSIKKLTTLIEPVFLIVMGGMVGFIMASMLLPIFDMVKTLKH